MGFTIAMRGIPTSSPGRDRAADVVLPGLPEVRLICPDPADIALAKLCAWREKGVAWLRQAVAFGVIDVEPMRARAPRLVHPGAPVAAEIERRLLVLSRPGVAGG